MNDSEVDMHYYDTGFDEYEKNKQSKERRQVFFAINIQKSRFYKTVLTDETCLEIVSDQNIGRWIGR